MMAPTMRYAREAFVAVTVIQLVTAVGFMPRPCPAFCHCDGRTKTVRCLIRDMFTQVPLDLPHNTKTLHLQDQNITQLGRISPRHMPSLRKLILSGDKIHSMREDALSSVPNVRRLDLSNNFLNRIPRSVSILSSLKELVLHNNRVSSLRVDDLANLTYLEVLNLDNNAISSIPPGAFRGLPNLTLLYLANNSISVISSGIFGNLSKLEELHLTYNRIQAISPGWLDSVLNIWILEMGFALAPGTRSNLVGSLLTTSTGLYLPNLERLVLRGNGIVDIPCQHFVTVMAVTYLDLSINAIKDIPRACFSGLVLLDELILNRNAISSLDSGDFLGCYSLWNLDLSLNLIRELPQRGFLGTANLNFLDLSLNRIHRLHNESFTGLESLQFLYFFGNRLERISRSILRPLRSVEILDLRWNRLVRVSNQFCNMSALTNLALTGNLIEYISPEAFQGSNGLGGLFLDDNRLRTVAEETFNLPNLVDVKLEENPWHCDCHMRWIREAMFPDNKRHEWMLYTDANGVNSYKGIKCITPHSFANVSVFLIEETEIFRLICTSYVSPLAIEFIVGVSFAIIASSTLCYVSKLYCKVRQLERTGADTSKCLS